MLLASISNWLQRNLTLIALKNKKALYLAVKCFCIKQQSEIILQLPYILQGQQFCLNNPIRCRTKKQL